LSVAAALLASAEGYTPRATKLLDAARDELADIGEVAAALAENLPEPKPPRRSRRRRRRKKRASTGAVSNAAEVDGVTGNGVAPGLVEDPPALAAGAEAGAAALPAEADA
jgi:hypothetical protein